MRNFELRRHTLSYLYSNMPSGLISMFLMLLLIRYTFIGESDPSTLDIWFYINFIILLFRSSLYIYYKFFLHTVIETSSYKILYTLFFITTVGTGLILGFSTLYILPDNLAYQMIIFLAFVSFTSGAVVTYSSRLEIFYLFLVSLLSPMIYFFFSQGTKEFNILAFILLTYIVVMLVLSKKLSTNITTNFLLAQKNQHLVEELKQKVQEVNRATEAKSKFVSSMSHELRTPLNSILGFSYVLQKESSLDTKVRTYIEKINSSGSHLLSLINSILDFSKLEARELHLEAVEFDLSKTIEDVFIQQELKAQEKNITLYVTHKNELADYYIGDSLRLAQILTNLLTNAIKFTQEGSIGVIIEKIHTNRLRFEIKDTGIGLSKEQIEKLFNPFMQADDSITRNYGGTGLGLSISKEIIELMNGKIWIESTIDKGSSFIFEVDLKESYKLRDEEQDKEQNLQLLKGRQILLAEDNKTNQLVLMSLLEDCNVTIDIANDGREALAMFQEKEYELILMDLQMPHMDGFEATEAIRLLNKEIPIIALSANIEKRDIEHSHQVGMNAHLKKPIEIEKLYSTLFHYLLNK